MSPADREIEIAVVGAGPVGLAAALLLSDLGHRVALVAPQRPPADERTSALLAGSVALLERVGVWQQVAGEAAPLRTMRIVDGTRRLIRAPEVAFHAQEIGLEAFGYNLPNAILVSALENALGERPVERCEAFVEAVEPGDTSVALTLSTGDVLAARLVVAADGRRSKVRDGVGISTQSWRYDQAALVCNLTHTVAHDDTSTEFHTEWGPFTLVPLPGNRSSLVWVDRPAEVERRMALSENELAAEIEARSQSVFGAVALSGKRQMFPLSGMNALRFAARRVALAGEAAHLFPPIGAQGLNLGYRDVAALADCLPGEQRDDPGAETVLAAYDRARRGDVFTRTAAVDALNRTLLSPFLPVQALRGAGLFLLDRVAPLRRLAMRQGVALTGTDRPARHP